MALDVIGREDYKETPAPPAWSHLVSCEGLARRPIPVAPSRGNMIIPSEIRGPKLKKRSGRRSQGVC